MKKEYISENLDETRELGRILAAELQGGEILCLSGELGAGKTSFSQGILEGLKISGPHTSPTFVVMKEYDREQGTVNSEQKIKKVYHIDVYRVSSNDILDLGWEEMVEDKNNVIIIEWAERIADIIPASAIRISFEWLDENRRKIILKNYSN